MHRLNIDDLIGIAIKSVLEEEIIVSSIESIQPLLYTKWRSSSKKKLNHHFEPPYLLHLEMFYPTKKLTLLIMFSAIIAAQYLRGYKVITRNELTHRRY